jgi:chromosome segregation ATPase
MAKKVKPTLTKDEESLFRFMNNAQLACGYEPFTHNQFLMMTKEAKIGLMQETIERLVVLRDKYKLERDKAQLDFEDMTLARETLSKECDTLRVNFENEQTLKKEVERDLQESQNRVRGWMVKATDSEERISGLQQRVEFQKGEIKKLQEQLQLHVHAKTGLREILDHVIDRIQGPAEAELS